MGIDISKGSNFAVNLIDRFFNFTGRLRDSEGQVALAENLGGRNDPQVEALALTPLGAPDITTRRTVEIARLDSFIQAMDQGTKALGGYQEGGLVDLSSVSLDQEIIVVGDIHARAQNIERILKHQDNLGKLHSREAIILFLGDLVHSEYIIGNLPLAERNARMPEIQRVLRDMEPSVETMRLFMDLKKDIPTGVYSLLGNHDPLTLVCRRAKIDQSSCYREALLEKFGSEYVEKYKQYIEKSALVAVGPGFAAAHAGPISEISLEGAKLLRFKENSDVEDPKIKQAINSRYVLEGYTLEQVDNFLTRMGQASGSLLVGHSPLRDGNWCWRINEHHFVIYGAHDRVGYASVKGGELRFVEV